MNKIFITYKLFIITTIYRLYWNFGSLLGACLIIQILLNCVNHITVFIQDMPILTSSYYFTISFSVTFLFIYLIESNLLGKNIKCMFHKYIDLNSPYFNLIFYSLILVIFIIMLIFDMFNTNIFNIFDTKVYNEY